MPATRTPQKHPGERTIADVERYTKATQLRTAGLTYREIGDQLGVDTSTAFRYVQRAHALVPAQAVAELRAEEDEHLRALRKIAYREATRDHLLVQAGKIVTDAEGRPLIDHGAKLAAVTRALAISESLRRLHGVDPPTKVRVETVTEDVIDAEIRRLEAEMAEREQAAQVEAEA